MVEEEVRGDLAAQLVCKWLLCFGRLSRNVICFCKNIRWQIVHLLALKSISIQNGPFKTKQLTLFYFNPKNIKLTKC